MNPRPRGVITSVPTDDRHLRTLNICWDGQPESALARIEDLVCTPNDDYTPLSDEAPGVNAQCTGTIVAVDSDDHRFLTLVVEWDGGPEPVEELVRIEHLIVTAAD
ncbi:hypothetical protein MUG78_16745 [Gordonia alkaliphila]|uniref:hypothetical protein n=1 Tax=Gordonia alkaliphila TaxID=1053547 RepID=UPI001FF5C255|nr:hypothetical protein [Gordonia alkaliphila]MCK0441050.1 hypothetical protein [Gordonia alkaliphila]